MKLTIRQEMPAQVLAADANALAELLPGPTLFELPGEQPRPLFVSVLMHGNEPTGWAAIQRVLRHWQGQTLPRALSLFIGNVDAAARQLRHLPEQPDYNRIWPGTDRPPGPEATLLAGLTDHMRERRPIASIDLHNNTGANPHYACVNQLDADFLSLAAGFSSTVVYFLRPLGVQSMAFAPFCPAVTLECGQAGERDATDHAADYVLRVLETLDDDARGFEPKPQVDLYHTVATVKIADQISFGFDCDGCALDLHADIERYNFADIEPGTAWGKLAVPLSAGLKVTDETGRQVSAEYFHADDGQILRSQRAVTPAMLTRDTSIVRDDCLCYLMERLPLPY